MQFAIKNTLFNSRPMVLAFWSELGPCPPLAIEAFNHSLVPDRHSAFHSFNSQGGLRIQCISLCYGIGTILAIFLLGFRPFVESTASIILHSNDAAPRLVDTRTRGGSEGKSPHIVRCFEHAYSCQSWRSGRPPKSLLTSKVSCLR